MCVTLRAGSVRGDQVIRWEWREEGGELSQTDAEESIVKVWQDYWAVCLASYIFRAPLHRCTTQSKSKCTFWDNGRMVERGGGVEQVENSQEWKRGAMNVSLKILYVICAWKVWNRLDLFYTFIYLFSHIIPNVSTSVHTPSWPVAIDLWERVREWGRKLGIMT